MRLRPRLWLWMGVSIALLVAGLLTVVPRVVLRGFLQLEHDAMHDHRARVMAAFRQSLEDLSAKCADWAIWDDTYKFVVDRNPAYLKSNLVPETFQSTQIDLIAIIDLRGAMVYATARDHWANTELPVPQDLVLGLRRQHMLVLDPAQQAPVSGLVMFGAGPMLLVSHPILDSNSHGPARGSVVFGRWVNDASVQAIGERTLMDLKACRLDRGPWPTEMRAALPRLLSGDSCVVAITSEKSITAATVLRDQRGVPAIGLVLRAPRPIYAQGLRSVRVVVVFALLATLFMGIVMVILMERLVIHRLTRLGAEVTGIGQRSCPPQRLRVDGSDEIAQLAADVNGMLGAAESSQSRVLESESILRSFYDHGTTQRGLVERSEDGVVRFLECNVQSAALFGREPAQVIGQTATELSTSPEMDTMWSAAYDEAARTAQPHSFEFTVPNEQGPRCFTAIISPVQTPTGALPRFGYLVEDVTERRRVEFDLRVARDAAEAANRAKSQFLSTMSHEIRTPMNGVLGMASLLLDTSLNAVQQEYARVIHSSGESLLDLLNDILDLSKIEADRLTLEPLPFDIQTLAEDLAELMQGRAREHDVEIIVYVHHGTPRGVVGDSKRLRQVLLNLLGNAIKFTQHGCVVLGVESQPLPEGGVRLRISVTDTGIGVSAENQAQLFQPFTQADASTARKFGGTGLGLAISKRLIELMGGTIGFTSDEGLGSVFWFEAIFPLAPVVAPAWPVPRSGLRALVIDDLAPARGAIVDALATAGVVCKTVATGHEAFEALTDPSEGPFDVIISDAPHADVDCHGFARACNRDPQIASIPRVLIALDPDRTRIEAADDMGCSAYLAKPVRAHVLLAAIEAVTRDPDSRPRTMVTLNALAESMRTESARPTDVKRFEGARVLVAEDNLVNQKVVMRFLERFGCHVTIAADGAETIEKLAREPFDLVLMDVHMPTVDGLEATRRIRVLEATGPRIPIVALTANSMSHERQAAIDSGMDDFLSKPIRREELAAMLGQWLSTEHRRAA